MWVDQDAGRPTRSGRLQRPARVRRRVTRVPSVETVASTGRHEPWRPPTGCRCRRRVRSRSRRGRRARRRRAGPSRRAARGRRLLDRHRAGADRAHPRHVSDAACVRLRDGTDGGHGVDPVAQSACHVVPAVGVAPVLAPEVVREAREAVALVQAPRDEAGAGAEDESPRGADRAVDRPDVARAGRSRAARVVVGRVRCRGAHTQHPTRQAGHRDNAREPSAPSSPTRTTVGSASGVRDRLCRAVHEPLPKPHTEARHRRTTGAEERGRADTRSPRTSVARPGANR